ncbi:hypothetical protein MUY27_18240 [Mucilaginibacter sp. RS28]|uniref:Uncharacterized protein n=1 Tax=Mucilaginibacter straminoryzae TaxID=2932774 RepID=A0A9X2BAB5_9SPHI|nr:hypothetical protein [Mucilaginibacter straminoryzae]MCJ8211664.1 hypothetical protein [Mucilaginibacter straminoryzae]
MTNKLLLKHFPVVALIAISLSAGAQDTTKKVTAPAKTINVKPKPAATQQPAANPYKTVAKTPAPGAQTGAQVPAATNPRPYTTPVQTTSVAPNDRSLNGQYQFLLSKTYNYQRGMLAAFYKSVTDSLKAERKKITPLQTQVAALNDSLKATHTALNEQQKTLDQSNNNRDSISLLGINMSKSSYNSLMWGLVLAFGAVAAIVIVRSGSYSREAKYRVRLYEELDEEYKTYKVKANEKEKKLARELQTARNKLEEITGKPEY